jgi:MoxR-like ATPase
MLRPGMATSFHSTSSYLTSEDLRDAVDVAIALEKPLLIKGEPGTGKTRLAEAIAEAVAAPLLIWNVKSTTKAKDGLYVYDTIARLNDARFGDCDVRDISAYIKMGPLGRSFVSDQRCVVLIDEVDKADLEFANDLLHELDRMSFSVDETGQTHTAKHRPIVIITSNSEKELPDAFLRRCVFHYLSFPQEEMMREIVKVHHPDVEEKLLKTALMRFFWMRKQTELRKKPSTSELIDWIGALMKTGVAVEKLQTEIPFMGLLLKKEADVQAMINVRPSAKNLSA